MSRSPSAISDGSYKVSSSRRNSAQPPPPLQAVPRHAFTRTSSQGSATGGLPPSGPTSNPPSASPSPRLSAAHLATHPHRSASASSATSHPKSAVKQHHDASLMTAVTRVSRNDSHHPRYTNFRGYIRCRHCQAFVPDDDASVVAHEHDCPFQPLQCPLVDSETGDCCTMVARGMAMLHEHQQRCTMRTIQCTAGCGAQVSLHSMAKHLHKCSQQLVHCVACRTEHPRSDEAAHSAHCPESVVDCPLGCGITLRRGDVPRHVRETAASHSTRFAVRHSADDSVDVQLPGDCPVVVYSILLDVIHEMRQRETLSGLSRRGTGGVDGETTPPQRNPNDTSAFDVSPFSPKGAVDESDRSNPSSSVSVFSALVTSQEVAKVSVMRDAQRRIEEAILLTEVLFDALRLHDTKDKVLENEDLVSGRATAHSLRRDVDGAVQRVTRVWRICGLEMGVTPVPTELKRLRDAALQVQRIHLTVKCALYDCL